jgi:ferric-dicitrate binding protein FerR (iron transport regulator)
MTKELFRKYLDNNCSRDKVDQIIAWFTNDDYQEERKEILAELWKDESTEDVGYSVNFNSILDKVHHSINLEAESQKGKDETRRSNRVINVITRVAAILLVPLLIYNVYTFIKNGKEDAVPVYSKIFAPMGSHTTFELPDGSKVWLNSGSSIRFPQKFTGGKRMVELDGEAYFEVVHDPDKPMIVKADDIYVKVLGTKFNVMNYDDGEIEVTLLRGSVSLNTKARDEKHLNELIRLKPGQQAIYKKDEHRLSYRKVNVDKYVAWTTGKVMFENDPLDEVARQIGRAFNIIVEIEEEDVANYTFTATFIDESLPQILKLIKLALPVEYKEIKSRKRSDGTFSQTKIIIKKRKPMKKKKET